MALTYQYGQSTISYKTTGAPPANGTRNDFRLACVNSPPKVGGSWIVFADGSRFRRATAYSRSKSFIEPGASQSTSGKRFFAGQWVDVFAKTSAGGYRGDTPIGLVSNCFINDTIGITQHTHVPFIPTNRRNEAVTKALLSISGQKAGLGEDLGSLGQTIRMLHNPASTLIGSLRRCHADKALKPFLRESIASLRKMYVRGKISDWAFQRYLEYVYGWKPLVQDIYGLIELAKQKGDAPLFLRGTGTSKVKLENPDWTFNDASYSATTKVTSHAMESRVACTLWARVDPNWAGVRSLNQLGLANPLALAWELAGWSFVVDWLLPIGPVLNALSAPAGLAFVDGSISNRVKTRARYEHWYNAIDSYASSNSHASGTTGYDGYRRDTLSNWPLPGLWFDHDPLRSDRPLKALALLWLQLSRLH